MTIWNLKARKITDEELLDILTEIYIRKILNPQHVILMLLDQLTTTLISYESSHMQSQ